MLGTAVSELLACAIYLLVLVAPGLAVARSAGIRSWSSLCAAPMITYGLIGVFGPVVPMLGARWSILALGCCAALVALVILLVRKLLRRRDAGVANEDPVPWSWSRHAWLAAAVLVATAMGVVTMGIASRDFTAIPQWWDAEFHANAIRFIADTGNSAPSALAAINDTASTGFFYPNAYHVLDATVVQIGGWQVPQVLDVSNAFQVGLFSLSSAVLVKEVTGRPALSVATGVLACAFTAFPYDVLVWGPLFPFTAGVALIPGLLAMLVRSLSSPTSGQLAVTAICGVGLTAVHPSVTIAAVIPAVLYLAQRWIKARRVSLADLRALGLIAVLGLAAGFFQLLGVLMVSGGAATFTWPPNLIASDAVGQLATGSRSTGLPQWWLVALCLVGVASVRSAGKLLWWLIGGAVFGLLFVLDASSGSPLVVRLTQPWWNDAWRLYALAALGMVVLAAVGLVAIGDALAKLSRRRIGAMAVVVLVIAALTHGLYAERNTRRLAFTFSDGPVVSQVERSAMHELAKLAPQGSLVMNDPFDGSPWMWSLEGVHPVFGHAMILPQDAQPVGAQRVMLLENLNKLDTDSSVRAAIRDLGIRYVFLSDGSITGVKPGHGAGLTGLDKVKGLRLVFANAQAQIYQVVVST